MLLDNFFSPYIRNDRLSLWEGGVGGRIEGGPRQVKETIQFQTAVPSVLLVRHIKL